MRSLLKALVVFTASIFLLFSGIVLYVAVTAPDVSALKKTIPFPTAFMKAYQEANTPSTKKARRLRVKYIPLTKIPEILQRTVILAEDASFWVHHGIDWYEVRQSFWKNLQKGQMIRGGSTITQQVAKNVYLSGRKTFFRKFQEYWIAQQLESTLRKRRILEIYLNIIEMGPGVYGVNSGAWYYFRKPPHRLTLAEMVMLAATIPSPRKHNPYRRTRQFYWRCQVVAKRLWRFHVVDDSTYHTLQASFNLK